MKIRIVNQSERYIYDKYAKEYGTVFNSLDWLSLFDDNIEIFGFYDEGDNILGGFFIYKEKKFGLSVYHNPAFTPVIGPFLKLDAQSTVSIMDRWKEALTLMAELMDRLPYSIISFSMNMGVVDTQPFYWKRFRVVPVYTYLIDLGLSLEQICKHMSHERRKNIKKAEKDKLIVRPTSDTDIISFLIRKTYARQRIKTDCVCMYKIIQKFLRNGKGFAFVTFREDIPIACTFCVHDAQTAYYLMGGYDETKKHHGAGTLSMWEAIKHAKFIGLRNFDLEGSMVPQIERYFRGFGGRLTPYYRINKAKLPIEILLKFFKRELF